MVYENFRFGFSQGLDIHIKHTYIWDTDPLNPALTKERFSIFAIFSDISSLQIFRHIARSYLSGSVDGTSVPITTTSLTRRQYYKRISELIETGLIARTNHENYIITTYGILVYHELLSLENIVVHQPKIEAVDSIRTAISNNLNTDNQLLKILTTLIDDREIIDLLVVSYGLKGQYGPQILQANQQQI